MNLHLSSRRLPAVNDGIDAMKTRTPATSQESAPQRRGNIPQRQLIQPGTSKRGHDGGKGGAGVAQWLISMMPPHRYYYEPFLGDGAVLRKKRPATVATFGCDLDLAALQKWRGDEIPGLSVLRCDGLLFLSMRFGFSVVAGLQDLAPGDGADHLVYFDSPYPQSVCKSDEPIYRYTLSDAEHALLLQLANGLRSIGVNVIVSSYWNEQYADALDGWRTSSFKTIDRAGNRKTEFAWLSFDKPAVLHDPRFVGGNKTRRVTVRRRADTWAAGLARMPAHERQRVFEACCEAMGIEAACAMEFCSGGRSDHSASG